MLNSSAKLHLSKVFFRRPNQIKALSRPSSSAARRPPLLVSTAAALLVIASAGFGVMFAWEVGSKHDLLLGAISVAMALGLEVAKPFAIASAFTSLRQLRIFQAAALALAGGLAVAYSLQAELTFMSMTRGDLVAERAGEHDAAKKAEARYDRAEAELATLAPARPAAEVGAEIGALKHDRIFNRSRQCTDATRPESRDLCGRIEHLAAEQARAERRAVLEAAMAAAEQDRNAAPAAATAVADPGAVAIATYAGALGWRLDPDQLGRWLPLIGVLALEIGAAFSVVLVRATSSVPATFVTAGGPHSPASSARAGDDVAHQSAETVQNRKSGPPKRATKAKRRDRRPPDDDSVGPTKRGLAGLLDAVQANGGVIDMSQRKLARRIGASRSTLQRTLHDLAEAGAVMLDTSKSGTRLAIV